MYVYHVYFDNYRFQLLRSSQKANKTVPTDQQGQFGWIKKDSTDMYKQWE